MGSPSPKDGWRGRTAERFSQGAPTALPQPPCTGPKVGAGWETRPFPPHLPRAPPPRSCPVSPRLAEWGQGTRKAAEPCLAPLRQPVLGGTYMSSATGFLAGNGKEGRGPARLHQPPPPDPRPSTLEHLCASPFPPERRAELRCPMSGVRCPRARAAAPSPRHRSGALGSCRLCFPNWGRGVAAPRAPRRAPPPEWACQLRVRLPAAGRSVRTWETRGEDDPRGWRTRSSQDGAGRSRRSDHFKTVVTNH